MHNNNMLGALLLLTCGAAWGATELKPPIDAFARYPAVDYVRISPDGRYISYLSGVGDKHVVVVVDRKGEHPPKPVLWTGDHDRVDITWCRWANDTRLLCGIVGSTLAEPSRLSMVRIQGEAFRYATSRLVAINADGSDQRTLIDRTYADGAQFQDRVIDWTHGTPASVLIELDHDADSFPTVFELDVYNGKLRVNTGQHAPIRSFLTDGAGSVRLGEGSRNSDVLYFAREAKSGDWRELARFEALSEAEPIAPLAVEPGTDLLYFRRAHQGRAAIWRWDMSKDDAPQVAFNRPDADLGAPILLGGGRLVGFDFDADKRGVVYTDAHTKAVVDAIDRLLPDTLNFIEDVTPDQKTYIVRSENDINAGRYTILETGAGPAQLKYLGSAYPELEKYALGRMEPIRYAARDGTKIPGYLTLPEGGQRTHLPLVVLPHGGPIARDSWEFFFLRNFLASRGYAVLQMNFRGSGGFGWDWFHAAHQDWGGLTYDDIVDGARWAIAEKIADPSRVAIVGWSFGGYTALLGAVRDGGLFRCAVSIAGVADLIGIKVNGRNFVGSEIVNEQIGSSFQKLKADSPRLHAREINVPVLLIHGDFDWNVPVSQSETMAAAMKAAGKPHEFLLFKDADHHMRWKSDRQRLLEAVERFLAKNLAAAP